MSCSLRCLPSLPDLCHLKSLLFPEGPVPGESNQDDDYDNRWSWGDELDVVSQNRSQSTDHPFWIERCLTSISPDGSFYVIAHGQRVLCLSLRGNSWHVSSCKTLEGFSHFEKITSVALIPLLSQLKSHDGGIDWIALLVGSTHGVLRVLTGESATPLIIQKFCEDPLRGIKCSSLYSHQMSGQKRHYEQHDQLDDICLVFKNMVAVIEGFSFYQTIRSTRNHLAKLRLDENAVKHVLEMKISLQAHKWILDSSSSVIGSSDANVIKDVESGGECQSTAFDQMVTASFSGPTTRPKRTATSATQFITTGETPFIGFYRTIEVESGSLLNNVAQAAVSKVKNFLPLFSSSKDDCKSHDNYPVRIIETLGIYDQHREGLSVIFSRDKSIAVVTDDFGRVSLVDAANCLIVRIWKGYREAQCAIVTVPEDISNLSCRKVKCLVIYAPKRGLLEIWRLDLGPRLASFNVGKNCHLFHSSHGAFGMTVKSFDFSNEPKIFLLDHSNGKLFSIDIPFVCTLTDENSRNVRDSHFVKEFKSSLTLGDTERQFIAMKQIQTASCKSQVLNLAMDSGMGDALFVAESFIEILFKENPEYDLDIEHKLFLQSCFRVLQLIKLYSFLSSIQDFSFPCWDFQKGHPPSIHDFASSVGWSEVDVTKCLSLFSLRHSVVRPTESPSIRALISFQDFISFFVIETTRVIKSEDDDKLVLGKIPVDVKWKLDSSHCTHDSLSKFMFEIIFNDDVGSSNDLFKALDESCITPRSLLHLLFRSWLSRPSCYENWNNWIKFSFAVKTIGLNLTEVPSDDQSLPHSWQVICYDIISSKNIPAALIATFVVKNVTDIQFATSKNTKSKGSSNKERDFSKEIEDDEWETLHVDKERLNIVTKQMEDLFLLDLLLQTSLNNNHFSFENQSLTQLINSDSGIVSELISRWAITLDLDIESFKTLFKNSSDDCVEAEEGIIVEDLHLKISSRLAEEGEEAIITNEESVRLKEMNTIKELLLHVQRCFPHSLDRQVILINSTWECISFWMKSVVDGNIDDGILTKALNLMKCLSSNSLKHNLSCLIWKTFLLKHLEILALSTEKMGKIPKDRILRKELSIGEDCLEQFLTFSFNILEIILENLPTEDTLEEMLTFSSDDWWKNDIRHRDRRPPLILVASSSAIKVSNPSVVLVHLHLVQVMIFMVIFQLKNIRPSTLFSSVDRQVFFKDFSASFTASDVQEKVVCDQRVSFLSKVVTSVAQSIPSDQEDESDQKELLLTPSRVYSQATKWFRIVLTLANEWNLDTDLFRRKYVSELYANRCDSLAEELRNSCSDSGLLAQELVPIACQRILMHNSKRLLSLPPPFSQWMNSLECPYRVMNSSVASTRLLIEFIRSHLPYDSVSLDNLSTVMDHL